MSKLTRINFVQLDSDDQPRAGVDQTAEPDSPRDVLLKILGQWPYFLVLALGVVIGMIIG